MRPPRVIIRAVYTLPALCVRWKQHKSFGPFRRIFFPNKKVRPCPTAWNLILTLSDGLTVALVLGFITQKLRLSSLVGYLLAGIVVGPCFPGFVADPSMASQYAEIGVILLMLGVGLHFHLNDLLAVQKVALPEEVVQIAASIALGATVTHFFGWNGQAAQFSMAISVASTVVLTRVLADNRPCTRLDVASFLRYSKARGIT